MAERDGTFSLDDVTDNISRKLIFRHSHVFGSDRADSPDAVLSVWEKNKMLQKNQINFSQTLLDVPKGLPALMKSEKLQRRAAKAGLIGRTPGVREEKSKKKLPKRNGNCFRMEFLLTTRWIRNGNRSAFRDWNPKSETFCLRP